LLLKTFIPNISSGVFVLLTVILTIIFSSVIHYIDKPIVKLCRKR
jgi:peptidoglycan/LPS O-acetylase OafA/YrhL